MSLAAYRQRGATLAELLVAMAVGLFVLLAAGSLFVMANRAFAAQVQAAALEDGGRYALDLIGRALRRASYVDWDLVDLRAGPDDAVPARLTGLDSKSVSKASHGITDPLPTSVNGSDVLAVRFSGAGPGPHGDGSMVSCAGFSVGAGFEGWSIFYVARNGQGEPELRCKYRGASGWSADAVVSGVDAFQVLYGVDTDSPADGVANRYINASAIDALDANLVPEGASQAEREHERQRRTYWKRVVSVKVALLLHAEQPGPARAGNANYRLFGSAYDAHAGSDPGSQLAESRLATDGRARERRLFTATVFLRQR